MPLALVFTSAPQGLHPGRSGFCTVARHAEMPERLAALLEGLGTPHATAGTATFTLRRLEAGGKTWHVLSRFTAGGLDYTRRDNRLAHHLAFAEPEIAALPPPADIAARWPGWLSEWEGPPRWLEPMRLQLAAGRPLVPCAAWRRTTGSGAKAAWLITGESPMQVAVTHAQDTGCLLELFAESGALLGRAAWAATFTTDAATSGAEGFAWCGGEVAGRRQVDLTTAGDAPLPEGDKARLAAFGVAARSTPAASGQGTTTAGGGEGGGSRWLLAGLAVATLAIAAAFALRRPHPAAQPAPPAPTAPRAPTAEELAAAAALLRANDALRDLQDVVGRGDLVAAARQWGEIAQLSPDFTARHRDQFLPRIQAGIAKAAADAIDRQLSAPGIAEDPAAVEGLLAQAQADIRTATEIGAPRDAAWKRLQEMESRVRLLAQLDIRDTWLVTGQWVTGSAGAGVPSAADFDLGREAGEAVGKFLRDGLTGGAGTWTPVTLRLCDFRSLAQRDSASRPLRARLEPGANSLWVSEDTGGGRRPSLTVSVGTRANTVSVNFPGNTPAGFAQSNHAVELTNAAGKRLCIALLARPEALEPIRPGLGGLSHDPSNLVTGPAAWIEPAFLRVRMSGGRLGLYPAGHEFPERVASLSCSRNLIDTDLIRLAANGSAPRAEIAERRRLLDAGDPVAAGGPWSIRFVDARGQPIATLAEFR